MANIGEYHGQYQFLGRLTRPLPVLPKDQDSIRNFIIGNPDGMLISYLKENEMPENAVIYYTHKYRGKTAVLWSPQRSPSERPDL